MDNSRICSGYHAEFQASAIFFKNLFQKTIKEFLPLYKDKLKDEKVVAIIPLISLLDITDTQLSKDENENPVIHITASLEGLVTVKFKMILKRVLNDSQKQLSLTLELEDAIDIPMLKIKYPVSTLIKEYPVQIPDDILSYVSGDFQLAYVQGDAAYEDVIAVMSNLSLYGYTLPGGGSVKAVQSFLPKGKEYAMGFNKNTYPVFSAIARIIVEKQIVMEPRASIKDVKVKPGDKCLKIVIDGKYDVSGLTKHLDPEFTITVTLSLGIKNKAINVNCTTTTKVKRKFLYSLLGVIVGFIIPGIGSIIGAHANSFIKIATKDLCDDVSKKVNGKLCSSSDYTYSNEDGVARMCRNSYMVTMLNCLPNEPIPLFKYSSDSIMYDYSYAIQLNYSSINVDDSGLSVVGSLSTIAPFKTCNKVSLKEMIYDDSVQLKSLVYYDMDDNKKELTLDEVLDGASQSERLNSEYFINNAEKNVRDAIGVLPLVILPKPIAVEKKYGKLYKFLFPNGLVGKVSDLAMLQKSKVLYIQGAKLIERQGTLYYKTEKDDTPLNNLESLPEFEL